jgi:hypothetical protein
MKQKTGMRANSGRMRVSHSGSFSASDMSAGPTNNVRADMPRDAKSGRFAMGKGSSAKSDLDSHDAKKATDGLQSGHRYKSSTVNTNGSNNCEPYPIEEVTVEASRGDEQPVSPLGYIDTKMLGYLDPDSSVKEALGHGVDEDEEIEVKDQRPYQRNKKGSWI